MLQRLRGLRAEGEGFTLIELLIVIVILGILAAIVVFAVGGITNRGDAAACKSDYKTVETAQEAYYAKSNPGAYAASTAALVAAKLMRTEPNAQKYAIETFTSGKVWVHEPPAVAAEADETAGNDTPAFCDTL